MLKRHSDGLVGLFFIGDLLVTAGAWWTAIWLRLHSGLFDAPPPSTVDMGIYGTATGVILAVAMITYRVEGLYAPRRSGNIRHELFDVFRSTLVLWLVLSALVLYLFRRETIGVEWEISRLSLLLFPGVNFLYMAGMRVGLRAILRAMRRRGHNLRHALVVGAGKLGGKAVETVRRNRWMGINVVGLLDHRPERVGRTVQGLPVLGTLDDLGRTIQDRRVDQVFLALPADRHDLLEQCINRLSEQTVDVRIIPDIYSFDTLNRVVTEIDGLPVISLRESPLHGWNQFLKRALDVAFSAAVLAVIGPLVMLPIALAVKLTSRGPVFYAQERMGLDGRTFKMLKFRTMRVDAERETGAVWARENDPRRTPIGSFLRKTSLDELPQFLNVLAGHMSVVGPRPERPVFIEEFKQTVPRYMLRHKMKAGITGWAQVNGWRGNTSLKKRIQYDLYYITNWTLGFDLWIMFLTVFRGLVHRNAY